MRISNHQQSSALSAAIGVLLAAAGGTLHGADAVDCSALFIPVVNVDQNRDEAECAAPQTDPLADYAKGSPCKLQVDFVHPTQPAVGMTAVNCKRDKLASKSESKLDKYLSKGARVVPTVIGPDGNYYITDHHHLSTAVYKTLQEQPSMQPEIRLYAQIVGNFYGGQPATGEEAMAKFWSTMEACNNAYLSYLGQQVDPLNPEQMPTALSAM